MNKFLYTNADGEPVYTASYSSLRDVPDVPAGYRRVELPYEADDTYVMTRLWLTKLDTLVERPVKPSHYHAWEASGLQWVVPEESVAALKVNKQADVDRLSDSMAQEPILYDGVAFDVDGKAVERIRVRISRIERGDGLTIGWIGWRSFSNSMLWATESAEVVKGHLYNLLRLVEDRHQLCLITAWGHKDAIEVMSNYEDIVNYDITANWP